ncbi:heme oxygenase (biliverdin-producing) [Marihabitans asiaticum]|uniref:Heme oxygenase n=1 Tax=Marihabitans asiaticum TaxID=415218 RepID=A0A560WGZ5_9MICO|nr:biliverdin-producing heme oxygenase [Marihabitans asiaticum]TWD16830.1 heme oxygenase [Marihabitans asiaticum]
MVALSTALKERTATAHTRAEESDFVTNLVHGDACRGAYSAMVIQHLAIYRALEGGLDRLAGHPLLTPVDDPALRRVSALEDDLRALGVEVETVGAERVLPATRQYVDALEGADAETLLANHYVRYLGDLSGGQIVSRLVQRHYQLGDDVVSFYRFPEIEKPKTYKDRYRATLDALDLSAGQRERVLDQAEESFEMNRSVFADLSAARGGAHLAAGVG